MSDLVAIKLTGLDGVLDTLRQLPAEVVSKRGGPVLAALKKGAKVIQQQEKANLRAAINQGTAEAETTGLLEKNVVVTRGKAPNDGNGERVLVRVRRVAYNGDKLKKGEKVGKRVTTLKTANLLEYGSSHQPATPWIRPAFAAKAEEAIRTVEKELLDRIKRITTKLSKGKP